MLHKGKFKENLREYRQKTRFLQRLKKEENK